MKKQSILIIGAGGYIGQHLTRKLAKKQKIRVLVLDAPPKDFRENPNIQVFQGSVLQTSVLRKALTNVDIVVNFAGSTTVEKRLDKHVRLNVLAQSIILEECLKKRVKKILFMSTVNVYQAQKKASSESDPISPQDVYSLTKMLGEKIYSYYSNNFNIASIVFRIGSVYGPGQRKGIVFSFAESMRKSQNIQIPKKPVYRDFIFIDDVVNAITKAITFKAKNIDYFNISSSKKTGLYHMARMAQRMAPFPITVKRTEELPKLQVTYASNEKAGKLLGFKPKTQLKDGLQKTLSSYKL